MAVSTTVKNFRDGGIVLSDGTGTPLTCTVLFDMATFAISGLKASLHEIIAYEVRGELSSLRKGKRTYPTFSLTAMMSELSDATNTNLMDFVRKTGAFAAALSTLGQYADVYTSKLVLTIEGSNFGASETDHVLTLNDCELTIDFAEGDPNTFTISGTVRGTVVAS